ncbi:MAC/perforin domain-containing protein [Fibrobacter sp. UBA4297]|uniref:MAC/perforin domain-containing protein n=1 Tax=Fibrobacter sp. UBA4297 TaxID=1946536 RepID=UPI0025B909D4|nr:MAC/perforin domain-containing protein [Fibrobacter sp. UBA4297]
MSTTTTKRTYPSRLTLTETFDFRGNVGNAKVYKYNCNLGDGDIKTGDGGKVIVSATANMSQVNNNVLRLTVRYQVWESSYFKKPGKNSDCLYFVATKDINIARLNTRSVTSKGNSTITTVATPKLIACPEAFYTDYYNTKDNKHGWYPIDLGSKLDPAWYGGRAPSNRPQSWIPLKTNYGEFLVKIDDGGNELTKAGNIGVKGVLNIPLQIVTEETTVTVVDDQASSVGTLPKTYGTNSVLSTISDEVMDCLGHGYDMCVGEYACVDGCKDPVMDIKALNTYRRINESRVNKTTSVVEEGKTFEEYTSDVSKKLEIKASASAFGATLSHQTSITSKKNTSKTRTCAFKTSRDSMRQKMYKIEGYPDSAVVAAFLNPNFLKDLDRIGAAKIVEKYGTHVLMGVYMGYRADYNYMYDRSVSKETSTTSISTSTSFEFSTTGLPSQKKSAPAKTHLQVLQEKLENATDAQVIKELAVAIEKEKNSSAKNTAKPAGDKTGDAPRGTGGSCSVLTEETSTNTSDIETENSKVEVNVVGGNTGYGSMFARDPSNESKYEKWVDSCKDPVFSDFVPGTIVPLYEIIPAGHAVTAAMVKNAISQYYRDNGVAFADCKYGTMILPFAEYRGKDDCVNYNELNGGKQDTEINTKSGKTTGWRVCVEPVNFNDGSFIVALTLTVYEGGRGAGKTELQLRKKIEVPRKFIFQAANVPIIDNTAYVRDDVYGTIRGKEHGYIDVTDAFRRAGCKFIDCDSARVYVKIDGGGCDRGNIGVQCKLKIPYIYY